ncbi:MAG: hypothetical protein ACKE9I_02965 [Methylophagaceae bacterium]
MIKDIWFDLDYEDGDDSRGIRNPVVLYTSKSGLSSLIGELKRVDELQENGRYLIDVESVDKIFDVPFTHIEIANSPLESGSSTENDDNWKKIFTIFGVVIFVIGFLSIYGIVRLFMDLIA